MIWILVIISSGILGEKTLRSCPHGQGFYQPKYTQKSNQFSEISILLELPIFKLVAVNIYMPIPYSINYKYI